MTDHYEAVIGLEVHAQLLTASKAFCACSARFGGEPNTKVCPVCLGLPGALPVLNRAVVEAAVRLGLALGSTVAGTSRFDRKNYFYPDLPKGYQISQYDQPICTGGSIAVDRHDGTRFAVGLSRIHIEEDAGKSLHGASGETLIDMNRSGVPLLEVVTEPSVRSAKDAAAIVQELRQIVTYLGICDGNMEEGSLRCDANVSLRKAGESGFGTRTEVKNMNSFRNVERAIAFEIERQTRLRDEGHRVAPETLFWDAEANAAFPMRGKEPSGDYRYFPEPDLPPISVDASWVDDLRRTLPELPAAKRERYVARYALPAYDAAVLTAERETADYFESVVDAIGGADAAMAKQASNWIMTEVLRLVTERKCPIGELPISAAHLASLLRLIAEGSISGRIAKEVFGVMAACGKPPGAVIAERGLAQRSDEGEIAAVVDAVLARNPVQCGEYRAGRESLLGFFVGEVMKETKGQANPQLVHSLLKKKLY